jgi:purine-binding chemotaxis protein CheW
MTGHETAPRQYLTFFIAGEEHGIDILRVREIIEYGTVTRIPNAPPFVRGIVNLRGSVVSVLDLAARLGLPQAPVTNRTCIVMVDAADDHGPSVLGLVADNVEQVLNLEAADIKPPPRFGTMVSPDLLLGVGMTEGRLVLLLDLDRIVVPKEAP